MIMDLAAVAHLVVLMVAVRAGLGFERRFDARHSRAKFARHFLQHMILGDAQEAGADLERNVAVAQVIRHAHEIGRFYMRQLLGRRDDFDFATVGRLNAIAAAQHLATRQDERKLFAILGFRAQTALLPQVEGKDEFQNRKYLCAIGSTLAGSQTSSSPSARTS